MSSRSKPGAHPRSRVTTSVLLGLSLLAACLVGSGTEASVSGLADKARTQPIDLLVTSGGVSPVTTVGGVPMLAPDAWMTPGAITPQQVARLRALPQVEVAAPVTYLSLASEERSQTVSTWVPATGPGADSTGTQVWRAQASYSVQDGTGTHQSDPQTFFLGLDGQTALLEPGARAHLSQEGDEEAVVNEQGEYDTVTVTSPAVAFRLPLVPTPTSLVALDPQAEAALASASGEADTAAAMTSLEATWQRYASQGLAGIQEAVNPYDPAHTYPLAQAQQDPSLAATTSGLPVPVLTAASGVLPELTLNTTTTRLDTGSLSLEDQETTPCQSAPGALPGTQPLGCSVLTTATKDRLASLPTTAETTSSTVTGPAFLWRHPAHPFRAVDGASLVTSGLASFPGADASYRSPTNRTVLLPLTRRASAQAASVEIVPAGAPVQRGAQWQQELYRPAVADSGQYLVPGLVPVATYSPKPSALAGTDPLAASTLATTSGQVAQDLGGRGAATSPAATVVPEDALDSLLLPGRTRPTAGVVRLRLVRDPDGSLPLSRIEETASRVSDLGLEPTVLQGASPATVTVTLGGSAPQAWHGEASETWTELGATTRVTSVSSSTTALLTASALVSTGFVALLSELRASQARRRTASLLLQAGWRLGEVTRRLLLDELPGALTLTVLAAGAVAVSQWAASPAPLALTAAVIAALYGLGLLVVVVAQARSAARPQPSTVQPAKAAAPTATGAHAPSRQGRSLRSRATGALARQGRRIRATRLGLAWSQAGAAAVTSATTIMTALAGSGLVTVLELASRRVGFSELASAAMRVSRVATTCLVVICALTALGLLVLTLRAQSADTRRAHRLLAASGWLRGERVLSEASRWGWEHLPVALALPAALAWAHTTGHISGQAVGAALLCALVSLLAVLITRTMTALPCDRPEEATDA